MNHTISPFAYVLLIAIAAVMASHTMLLMKQDRWLALDPLNGFWAGILVVYVLQPLAYSRQLLVWHSLSVLEETLIWTFVGLVCVMLGYESKIGVKLAMRAPRLPDRLRPGRLCALGLVLISIGALGYAYQMRSAGGAYAWLAVGRGGTDWANVSSYLAQVADVLPVGVVLILFHVTLHRVSVIRSVLAWMLGALLLAWFVYLGTRSRTIGWSLLMMAVWYLPRKRSPPAWLLLCGFLTLLTVSNFQAENRERFTNLSFGTSDVEGAGSLTDALPTILRTTEVNGSPSRGLEFNCAVSVVDLVPRTEPYHYGYGHLEVFTRPVPRELWPGKIYPSMEAIQGVLRRAGLSDSYVNNTNLLMGPALTFTGHWYYVGGAVGVMIGGLLAGVIFRFIRHIYSRAPDSEGGMITYAGLIIIGFVEAAATPLSWIYTIPYHLVPLLLALQLCRAPRECLSVARARSRDDSCLHK